MYNVLKKYCKAHIALTNSELDLLEDYFEVKHLKKKEFLLETGKVCNQMAFIINGAIRYFYIKDGVDKTCEISFEHSWVSDFKSFNNKTPCVINLQAIEATTVLFIRKERLLELYHVCGKYETFGRLMVEQVAERVTEMAMSFLSDTPEERFLKLIQKQPNLFQRVPQKHIATLLGVNPESLSRIRSRVLQKQKS